MTTADAGAARIAELKARFLDADRKTSSLALRELIRLGRDATPVLMAALTHANPRTRRLAAEGLSELADPVSADALFLATRDGNDEVRARAATALHRLGDARSLGALIATLNDYPDELHGPYTASMYPLMNGGKEVLPLAVPLLQAADALTRERALLIVKAVVSKHFKAQDWKQLWQTLGSFDPAAPQAERDNAAAQWQQWLSRQG
jgi:HEAT repeat protein